MIFALAEKMNKLASRIKALRLESGLMDIEVADIIGLSIDEYGDLEAYDDEGVTAISLKSLQRLAGLYNKTLLQLIAPEEKMPKKKITEKELLQKAKDAIADKELSLEQAEDQVGWYLDEFFNEPKEFIEKNPLTFLQDLATFLEVEWQSVVPD